MTPQDVDLILDRLDSLDAQMAQFREEQTVARLEAWLSKSQLAEKLGVSVRWIEKKLAEPAARRIPATRIAGQWKFLTSRVERWLEEEQAR
jgi:excisionase family DNA binding protein